jgi:hypothetical protein
VIRELEAQHKPCSLQADIGGCPARRRARDGFGHLCY